jgi:NTP pyrophosphatase (non-canonical NTP hydrolase)
MSSFHKNQTLKEFQDLIGEIYALPDDRLYSIWDLLTQQQRFTMRTLKGIRKGNIERVKHNLLISFSWLMAIGNRLHIHIEEDVWRRFPRMCSYCGSRTCVCKKEKPAERRKIKIDNSLKPENLKKLQEMFETIYPSRERTLADAGVHLAEEMGEMSEAIHNFLGQHLQKQFDEIKLEMSDYVSCIFGVANSAGIDVAKELEVMFKNNCHVCHEVPCVCSFTSVTKLKT